MLEFNGQAPQRTVSPGFLPLPTPVVLGAALDQDFARYQVAANLLPSFGALANPTPVGGRSPVRRKGVFEKG